MSRPFSLFEETPYGTWIAHLRERIRIREAQPGPLTWARWRLAQLRERIRSRETQPTGPFPWARSHEDTRHTVALVGLSAVARGLVVTF